MQSSIHIITNTQFFFTGRMPFLSPNQQCQSNEGTHRTLVDYGKAHLILESVVLPVELWSFVLALMMLLSVSTQSCLVFDISVLLTTYLSRFRWFGHV